MFCICCLNDKNEYMIDFMDTKQFYKLCSKNINTFRFKVLLASNTCSELDDNVLEGIINTLKEKYKISPKKNKNVFIFKCVIKFCYNYKLKKLQES